VWSPLLARGSVNCRLPYSWASRPVKCLIPLDRNAFGVALGQNFHNDALARSPPIAMTPPRLPRNAHAPHKIGEAGVAADRIPYRLVFKKGSDRSRC
jgi:hypothetical protein